MPAPPPAPIAPMSKARSARWTRRASSLTDSGGVIHFAGPGRLVLNGASEMIRRRRRRPARCSLLRAGGLSQRAMAQGIDLSSGGPVEVTARDGIEWQQNQQKVIATGDARAVRGDVDGDRRPADRLYRKKAGAAQRRAPARPPSPTTPHRHRIPATTRSTGSRPRAMCISTPRPIRPWRPRGLRHRPGGAGADRQGDLKLTTPQDVMTARDSMEYWSAEAHGGGARQCGGGHHGRAPHLRRRSGRLYHPARHAARRRHTGQAGAARGRHARQAAGRPDRRLRQAAAGRGVRQCRGAHHRRHRARRSRRLRARYRHGPHGRPCPHHPRREPAQRPGRRRQHEDRHRPSDRRPRWPRGGADHAE